MSGSTRPWICALLLATTSCAKSEATTLPVDPPERSKAAVPSGPQPLAFTEADPDVPPQSDRRPTVNLPPAPAFAESKAPTRYPDGAFSVRGLREDIDANVADGDAGVEVELRAYVMEVYVPPKCPEGELCPPAKQPHFWVADHPDLHGKRNAMMLVNHRFPIPEWDAKRWEGQPEVVVEEGKQYTFKGRFKRFSDTGFAFSRGLMEFVAYEQPAPGGGTRWIYPLNAPWHPLEIERMDRENQAIVEKARRAAERGRK